MLPAATRSQRTRPPGRGKRRLRVSVGAAGVRALVSPSVVLHRSETWEKELTCWWWNQVCLIWTSWEKSRTRSVTKPAARQRRTISPWRVFDQKTFDNRPVILLEGVSSLMTVTLLLSSRLTPWRCTTCRGSSPWCGTGRRPERSTCGPLWWRPWPPSAGQVRGHERTRAEWTLTSPRPRASRLRFSRVVQQVGRLRLKAKVVLYGDTSKPVVIETGQCTACMPREGVQHEQCDANSDSMWRREKACECSFRLTISVPKYGYISL